MAKIVIDAGHGLYTSGKRCAKALDSNETREWVLNDRVADELGKLLVSAGHKILRVDDTTGKTDVSLANRVKKANNWDADFYISVHHNSAGKVFSGGGTEVYVANSCSSKSVKAQEAIYKYAIKRCNLKGNRSDGTRSANFYVIRYTNMPACLIECGFMDSKVDIKYILDASWSKLMALGIAEGICEVFGGKVSTTSNSTDTKTETTTKTETVTEERAKPKELTTDGSWGKLTTYAAQYVLESTYDGIISDQPSSNKKYLTTASTETWKFKEKYSTGSNLIRKIQKLTEVPEKEIDGYFGKDSVKYLQKFLKKNGYYTGLISGKLNKATTTGFQKYINKKLGY